MADDDQEHRSPDEPMPDALAVLGHKLDTVAGAVAAIAASHTDLLSHVAEAESRRAQDAQEVAQRLDALERQVLAGAVTIPPPPGAPGSEPADLEPLRADIALCLDVVARLAEAVDRLDSRTEDRLAAVRDAAEGPAPIREQLAELGTAVDQLLARPPSPAADGGTTATGEGVEEVRTAVRTLTWQLSELAEGLESVLEHVDRIDVPGSLAEATSELSDRLVLHTDTALAGVLRLIDERLAIIREAIASTGPASPRETGGFEAGAVMGAAQAAWNRLEQRLDTEFDDLGRQLQSMAALIEQAAASADAAATRPVVSGDQLRKAAGVVKDTVVSAGRTRRERRGGPRGLNRGS